MPKFTIPSSKPNYNPALARAIFGKDLIVMSPIQATPGLYEDRDPTMGEEEFLAEAQAEKMTRVHVNERRNQFLAGIKQLENIVGRIGTNAHDDAVGCWSNDLPDGGDVVLEHAVVECRRFHQQMTAILRGLDTCYATDPEFNQPD